MNRIKKYIRLGFTVGLFSLVIPCFSQSSVTKERVAPGVYRLALGEIDTHTPYSELARDPLVDPMERMNKGKLPFELDEVLIQVNSRGTSVAIPLANGEQLYGFGMQSGSFQQRGLKKKPIVNDNPLNNLGPSHAPQTFYVSTAGYGIILNTARYTTFYCGTNKKKGAKKETRVASLQTEESALYKATDAENYVFVDIPNTKGIDIFIVEGPSMKNVVERYNLFSGGGVLPPLWGLGLKYRTKTDSNQELVEEVADYFRKEEIPCDVIGLEPGWQTAYYSCSYAWDNGRFPNPDILIENLKKKNLRLNLWEHAYVHPTSSIYDSLYNYSGDFLVWNGLVPDFASEQAKDIFSNYHKTLVEQGITGFKLDECDNSNLAKGNVTWSFPEMSVFPSGIDGEQMHQMFGSMYVKLMDDIFRDKNLRTYQDYRASGLFMSSVPATLYSDIYGQEDYVQMIATTAFSGLLWSPEVRRAESEEILFQRLQTVLMSPQAVVNSWFLKNPPWMQYDKDKNNAGEILPNLKEMEMRVRKLVNMRMSLIPYLYATFADYSEKGTPPFRPLVMDYPGDKNVGAMYDQYLIGNSLLAAPLYKEGNKRLVYFPEGVWYNLYTNKKYEGNQFYEIEISYDELPLYVKEGSILPLAKPLQFVTEETVFEIACNVYGDNPADFILHEDDGESYDFQKGIANKVTLSVNKGKGSVKREGTYKEKRYKINNWNFIH